MGGLEIYPFAEELALADGVALDDINAASALVNEATFKPDQNKVVLQEMVSKANALLNPDQGGETDGSFDIKSATSGIVQAGGFNQLVETLFAMFLQDFFGLFMHIRI